MQRQGIMQQDIEADVEFDIYSTADGTAHQPANGEQTGRCE